MQRSHPLQSTNPEYSLLESPGRYEFRVENWHLARDGSGRIIKGATSLNVFDAVMVVIFVWAWPHLHTTGLTRFLAVTTVILFLRGKFNQVIYESLVVIPAHGVQFETHRGLPPFILSSETKFVASENVQEVAINEGLQRWDVRYYLLIIKWTWPKDYTIEVAYPNLLPHYAILRHIYNSVESITDRA